MIIGVPREIKDHEHRVAVTPTGVQALVEAGHRVLVERGAGQGWRRAATENPEIARGINLVHGAVTHPSVDEAHGLVAAAWPQADRGL
jgi:alanine dehydrogenase